MGRTSVNFEGVCVRVWRRSDLISTLISLKNAHWEKRGPDILHATLIRFISIHLVSRPLAVRNLVWWYRRTRGFFMRTSF